MSKDILLLISPFFYPEPISTGKYNTTLALEIERSVNLQVFVICSYPIFPTWTVRLTDDAIGNVAAIRGGKWLRYPTSPILRRLILEIWFAIHVSTSILSLRLRGFNIAIAVHVFPPSLAAVVCSLLFPKGTLVRGIVHDLQLIYAERGLGRFRRLLAGLISIFERKAFNTCGTLVFLSDAMRKWAVDRYRLKRPLTLVRYPFSSIKLNPDAATVGRERYSGIDPEFRSIVYSGALGEKQNPQQLFEFLSSCVSQFPNWKAYIFSEGPNFDRLSSLNMPERVHLLPLVEEDKLLSMLETSDIQVIPQALGTSKGSLPSKLPNIVAAGTPILCITDPGSELEGLIREFGVGIVCNSWRQEDLSTAFDLASNLKKGFRPEAESLLRKFDIKSLVSDLCKSESIHEEVF